VRAIVALRGLGEVPLESNDPPPPGPLQAAILAQKAELMDRGHTEASEHGYKVCVQRVMPDMTTFSVTEPEGIPDDLLELHKEGKLHALIYVFEDTTP